MIPDRILNIFSLLMSHFTSLHVQILLITKSFGDVVPFCESWYIEGGIFFQEGMANVESLVSPNIVTE